MNLEKSSDATKTTTCLTNETPTIVQRFTSSDTLILIHNDNHIPIMEISNTSISICLNVVFWLIRSRKLGQHRIDIEKTLYISTLEFTVSNNVESTLCMSKLIWTTLGNVGTTFSFSTWSFKTIVNVKTTLWKDH